MALLKTLVPLIPVLQLQPTIISLPSLATVTLVHFGRDGSQSSLEEEESCLLTGFLWLARSMAQQWEVKLIYLTNILLVQLLRHLDAEEVIFFIR